MRKATATALFAASAALALGGCARTAPIQNVVDAPVMSTQAASLQLSQVRSAIIAAGTSLGWRVADAGPGKLLGTLNLRGHTAVVDIAYSAKKYSITYNRSENLNAGEGTIHSNYNGWIQNLDRAIRTEMARL